MKLEVVEADAEGETTLDGLLDQLDATAAAGREATAIRADRGPRIPKIEHVISYEWRPPPSREQVLKSVSADCCRRFNRFGSASGDAFKKDTYLRHEYQMNIWDVERIGSVVVPKRSIGNPKGKPGLVRYHAQSDPLPEPTDDSLHEQHRDWLKGHYAQRDSHIHNTYYALKKLEKAEEKAKTIQKKKETARDVMTRGAKSSDLSEGVKSKLSAAKNKLKSTRMFNKIQGIDVISEEDKKYQDALERARSDPVLALKQVTPRHQAKHLRSWKGSDRRQAWCQTDRCFVHTTPGAQQQEEHELHNSPRYRARGA